MSVFGAAPSIATMRAMNKRGQKMFTAGEFWYYFRVYLPFFGPIVFLVFMLSAILGWNTVQGHLILGSVVSLLATTSVVASYIMIVPWRKHPSVLILYRSLTSLVFSVNLLLDASTDNSAADSRGFAFVTEFMLILGECWLTTIAIDLVHSLTNPFISYRYNLQRFQVYNITFSFFLSLIFFFNRSCQDTYEHITWVKVDQSERSPCLWGYYFVWILMMYTYQLWATVFAYNRLRKGLSSSFDIRKQCANDTFKCLSVYAVYIVVLLISFITISLVPADERSDSPISTFTAVTLFFVANRGSVDAVAWFLLHDFIRSDAPLNQSIAQDDPDTPVKSPPAPKRRMTLSEVRQMEELEAGTRSEAEDQEGQPTRSRSLTLVVQSMNEITNATTDMDEADLSPQVRCRLLLSRHLFSLLLYPFDNFFNFQVNIALRQQVVQYVTMGVQEAINKPTPPPIKRTFLQEMQEFIYPITDFAAIEGMEVTEYILDATHPFKAFSPKVFKGLRMQEGIDDDKYLKTLQSTANERLSEGASGAFMFFCGGGEFIVKTIRDREARVLHASLKKYAKYLRRNRNSLLCRFLGSYSLAMYEQTFYFVVMLNCFGRTFSSFTVIAKCDSFFWLA